MHWRRRVAPSRRHLTWPTRWPFCPFALQNEGGIRRIYTIVVAALECMLVSTFQVGLLIELEMLIYALSAALFFYSFVYLRFQRQAKFKYVETKPTPPPPPLPPRKPTHDAHWLGNLLSSLLLLLLVVVRPCKVSGVGQAPS